MIRIGLTGGIGAGKSTVSEYLIKKGYKVLDADLIAKELTKKGGEAVQGIVKLLGNDVINSDGSLNRRKIADMVYNDKNLLYEYEKLTTLKVIDILVSKMEELSHDEAIVFADVPLLFEKGINKLMDQSWVVISDEDLRIKRVIERDNIPEEIIRDIIKNQMPQEEKIRLADEVLDNSNTKEELYNLIDKLLLNITNDIREENI